MDTKLLRVSVVVVEKKKLTVFHLVNLWTLINAFSVTFAFAYDIIVDTLVFPRYTTGEPMTTADAADLARQTAILWCSAPQAVAGTLALLLPRHRRRLRRASAYAGLALTVAGNCILVSAIRAIVVDDPENLFFRIFGKVAVFECAVFDILAFLALVRGAGAGQEQQAYLINLVDLYLINLADLFT